jgi:hypothetical protein
MQHLHHASDCIINSESQKVEARKKNITANRSHKFSKSSANDRLSLHVLTMRLGILHCEAFYQFWTTSKRVNMLRALQANCSPICPFIQFLIHLPKLQAHTYQTPPPKKKKLRKTRQMTTAKNRVVFRCIQLAPRSNLLRYKYAQVTRDSSQSRISEWIAQTCHNWLPPKPYLLTTHNYLPFHSKKCNISDKNFVVK